MSCLASCFVNNQRNYSRNSRSKSLKNYFKKSWKFVEQILGKLLHELLRQYFSGYFLSIYLRDMYCNSLKKFHIFSINLFKNASIFYVKFLYLFSCTISLWSIHTITASRSHPENHVFFFGNFSIISFEVPTQICFLRVSVWNSSLIFL